MIVTLHDVRLRAEARNHATAAAAMLRGDITDAELEAAYAQLAAAAGKIHDLIVARIRGGDAGAKPRVTP